MSKGEEVLRGDAGACSSGGVGYGAGVQLAVGSDRVDLGEGRLYG
jgi:hypothetical protein